MARPRQPPNPNIDAAGAPRKACVTSFAAVQAITDRHCQTRRIMPACRPIQTDQLIMPSSNYYAGMPLSRDEALRRDDRRIRELRSHADTRVLALWRYRHLIVEDPHPRPRWLTGADAHAILAENEDAVFLGMGEVGPHFAVDLDGQGGADDEAPLGEFGKFVDLRAIGPLLTRDDGSIMAYARGLMFWQHRHRFCGACGHPNHSIQGGHVLKCSNSTCGLQHFPRTDPAVIMLVTHGDQCLLGRQKVWPQGMHSTLAGFVEPGESLEETVIREIYEEAGVRITKKPAYQHSQPWPFPSSIMLGFYAEADSMDLNVNTDELEKAEWYHRDDLLNSPEDQSFRLPRRDSIARRLVDEWLGVKRR